MPRLLREPLVQFLLGGAALFVLYGWVAGGSGLRPDRIVVTEAQVASLASGFERTWMRPPTRSELEGLVDDFVTEEILYREALALGLDRDDLIVRRRLRQKMEFLNEGLSAQDPSEAELEAFLQANPERFRQPSRTTFQQLFLNPNGSGPEAEERASELLHRLAEDPTLATSADGLGDPTLLPKALEASTEREIAASFGPDFANAIADAPVGGWSGPVPSSYGLHLVYVTAREPGRMPSLSEIRPAVEREWTAERRTEATQRFYRALRDRYEVEIQLPDSTGADSLASREP